MISLNGELFLKPLSCQEFCFCRKLAKKLKWVPFAVHSICQENEKEMNWVAVHCPVQPDYSMTLNLIPEKSNM